MEKEVTKRERWIDVVKGISIILVVFGHLNFDENFLCNWIYSFHIPIFFVISGILLSIKEEWKNKDIKSIIIKKFKQIMYPYITFSCLVLIYSIVMNPEKVLEIVQKTIFLEGYNTLWFLPCLFIAECLFLILQKNKVSNIRSIIIIFLCTFLFTWMYNTFMTDSNIVLNIIFRVINIVNRIFIALIFIFCGYLGYKKIKQFEVKYNNKILSCSIVFFILNIFLCQFNGLVDLHYSMLNNQLLYYICAIIGSWSLILIVKNLLLKCKILEFFGKNSLIIMATHLPLPVVIIAEKVVSVDVLNIKNNIVALGLELLVVLIIETLLIFIINKFARFLIVFPKKIGER